MIFNDKFCEVLSFSGWCLKYLITSYSSWSAGGYWLSMEVQCLLLFQVVQVDGANMEWLKNARVWLAGLNNSQLIAWLALCISFVQLLASAPLLTDFYNKPKLIISGSGSGVHEPISDGSYVLRNDGRSVATNVEVGFNIRIGDRVRVMPALAHKLVTDKDPVITDHARLEFGRILPGEAVMIIVIGSGESPIPEKFAKFFDDSGVKNIPSVSYLRSDQGGGQVNQSSKARREDEGRIKGPANDNQIPPLGN
ncbi:hypothetical protein ACQKO7_12860 [Pseudomonas putida]|uniref:hypothetical protein n=1 Tax=Pseudomonas putida TaxID=303 RepID=UPI003D0422C6